MKRLVVLSLLAPLAVLSTAGPARAAELCQGQAPTIVGTPGKEIAGTDGADVIVSAGATRVMAGAGDDVVCVTMDAYSVRVDADTGNDTVDTTGTQSTVHAFLADGADKFVGGDQSDNVYALGAEAAVDTITTGGGSDFAAIGRTGLPTTDVVDMGPGIDTIRLSGLPGPGSVTMGEGHDKVDLADRSEADWTLDNRQQEVSANGVSMTLTSALDFAVGEARWASLAFVGGAGREKLFAWQSHGRRHPSANQGSTVVADMAGGDDYLSIRADQLDILHGGDGDDTIQVGTLEGDAIVKGSVRADLRDGTVRVDDGPTAKVTAFNDVSFSGLDRFWVRLGAGADVLTLVGCRAVVHAGGGSDRVRLYTSHDGTCRGKGSTQSLRAYGEGGDDTLRGASGNDLLIGGPGDDLAGGSSGVDVCSAETRLACERR